MFKPGTIRADEATGQVVQFNMFSVYVLWFYNKTLWDKVGLKETPKTWTEFIKVLETFKDAGILPTPMAGDVDGWRRMGISWLSRVTADAYARDSINTAAGAARRLELQARRRTRLEVRRQRPVQRRLRQGHAQPVPHGPGVPRRQALGRQPGLPRPVEAPQAVLPVRAARLPRRQPRDRPSVLPDREGRDLDGRVLVLLAVREVHGRCVERAQPLRLRHLQSGRPRRLAAGPGAHAHDRQLGRATGCSRRRTRPRTTSKSTS